MKLGEALRDLKKLQNKLVRKLKLREDTFYIGKNKTIVIAFGKITEEINALILQIRELKLDIEYNNITSFLNFKGETVSIAELIIRMGDLKSELKQLGVMPKSRHFLYEKEEDAKIPQLNEIEIADRIEALEKQKDDLDKALQNANWTNDLKSRKNIKFT